MPTGVHLVNAQALLFDAAERVIDRDGASGLTSRAVTMEAGVAKGVIHRYFPDFDAFLAELILERVSHLEGPAARLRAATGTASIVDNLTEVMTALFSPLTVAEMALVVTRDGLRARLKDAGAPRLPLLTEATALISSYLRAEQDLGRIDPTAEPVTLAPTLIGAAHLLFTEYQPDSPDTGRLRNAIATVVNGAMTGHRHERKPSTPLV